jgi:2-polyprenyl-3-methyl-5-hydroxy-6-metoxy-1,4-benzoquinol methylase
MTKKKNPSAFEKYAHEYDLVTNAAVREKNHAKEVKAMLGRFAPTRVLDAGCATGLTTRLFAQQGIETVGLDCQAPMIQVASRHAAVRGLPVKFVKGYFESLPRNMTGQFDLIVCLANAIVGVETRSNVKKAYRNFYRVLKPGGWLVLQALNYGVVRDGELLPIKATENNGIIYERFRERTGRHFSVYVTRLDLNQTPPKLEVFRHDFDNFEPEYLVEAASKVGFSPVRKYGNLLFTKRFSKKSNDLVLAAQRPR